MPVTSDAVTRATSSRPNSDGCTSRRAIGVDLWSVSVGRAAPAHLRLVLQGSVDRLLNGIGWSYARVEKDN
jgi:hypothetical protein